MTRDYDTRVTTLRADAHDLRRTGAYYDRFADTAEERYASNHILVRVREAFRRAVEPHPARSVLDLGCGTGTDLEWFGERYPGREYAGIDVSPRMVEVARNRLGGRGVRIERGCAEDVPQVFAGERFDLVYSFFGPLNTEPDLRRAALALREVVTPGGILVATFVNRAYFADSAVHLLRGRVAHGLARWRNRWRGYSDAKPLHASLYFAHQIVRHLAPGFRVVRREGFSIVYPPWYRVDRFRTDSALVRALWLADRALNRTPLWSMGEHLLYVMQRV
jgi:SAM-dependent methyltransferase